MARGAAAPAANPYRFYTQGEVAQMFGFGEKSMRKLVALGAPTVAKKINPDHFKQWLWEQRENLGKLFIED